MRFVTLRRDDPKLRTYLLGTFSETERALPLEFYSPVSNRPTMTLRLEPTEACRANITFARIFLRLSRWRLLGFTTGALILFSVLDTTVFQVAYERWPIVTLILLSISCLHVGANQLNDYFDHLQGADILQNRSGSRVIQSGWLTALQVRHIAVGFLVVGGVSGVASLLMSSGRSLSFAIFAAVGLLSYSRVRRSLKNVGLAEVSLFLLCGPALIMGYQHILGLDWSLSAFMLSCWNGFAAAQYVFLRNWQSLQTDDLIGIKTLAVGVGFDRCRRILFLMSVGRWISLLTFALMIRNISSVIFVIFETVLAVRIFGIGNRIRSVFSSELNRLRDDVAFYSVLSLSVVVILGLILHGSFSL